MESREPDFSLEGKVVAITGGGGIIGRRLVAALVSYGASVAVIEPDLSKAEASIAAISASGARARAFAADVRSRSSIVAAADAIEEAFGPITGLLNNAATKSDNFFEPFESFPIEDWNTVMSVNLTGAMICAQVFGGRMAARKSGSIVNTLSVYGIVAPDQRIYEGSIYEGQAINTPAVYSASKAGLWGLTRYLATYWGARNVRVNALTPGGVFSGQNDVFVQKYSARVPLGRMAEQDELSGAMVFLVSDASSYITGQNIVVDGGLSAW
jgi:NAD(P)-dependent dehydrogenase (short-subunit alcohol dehydrogenase family)